MSMGRARLCEMSSSHEKTKPGTRCGVSCASAAANACTCAARCEIGLRSGPASQFKDFFDVDPVMALSRIQQELAQETELVPYRWFCMLGAREIDRGSVACRWPKWAALTGSGGSSSQMKPTKARK